MTPGSTFTDSWERLASRCTAPPAEWSALGADLRARHDEPGRHYHVAAHVEAVLRSLRDLAPEVTDAQTLAAFLHDAVYDVHRADNEERSARLAETELTRLGVAPETVATTAGLIRATAGHVGDEGPWGSSADTPAFLDADLSILAAPPADYDRYRRAIRLEYAHLSDAEFGDGRAAILERLLRRDRLYLSPAGVRLYEAAARRNVERELGALRSPAIDEGDP